MRAYSVAMVFGLLLIALFGFQFLASPIAESTIGADVNIVPDVFNVKRTNEENGVITAQVSNLEKDGTTYDVNDINLSTIKLYYGGSFVAEALRAMIENDSLIVKFDASTVANYIWINIISHMGTVPPQADKTITLTVSGQLLNNGGEFAGSDTIKIILP